MALGLAGVPSGYGGTFTGKTVADGISRLGLTGTPQGRFLQTTKNPAVSVGADPKTRLGLSATPRGPLGTFAGKNLSPDQVVTFTAGAIELTPQTFTVLQDRIIDFTGIDVVPVANDFEIIQGGQTVAFTAANLELTPWPFDIDQTVAGSTYVTFTSGRIVYTPQTFDIVQQKLLDFDTNSLLFTAQPFSIIPGVLGEQNLTNADLYAINQSLAPQFAAINESIANIQSQVTDSLSGVDFGPKGIYVPKKATPKERAVNQKRRKRKNKKLALDMLNTAMKLVTKEI